MIENLLLKNAMIYFYFSVTKVNDVENKSGNDSLRNYYELKKFSVN